MDKNFQKTSHILTLIIVGVLCFMVIVFVFGVGVFVGQARAEFSFRWAQAYHKNFGGPQMGIFSNFPNRDFTNAHGVFGQVIGLGVNSMIVKGQNGMETMVVISLKTFLVHDSAKITLQDIAIGDNVVIVGSPDNQGRVSAELIRVLTDV